MADVQPLRALHYDLDRTGPLQGLIAPPYDVIDPEQRRRLLDRSPYNVVAIDLPEDPGGGDRYEHAATTLRGWIAEGAVVRDDEPAMWALEQRYTGPDGRELVRKGVFARVRVEDYGPGRIRPHERTHPGPKEDRLRLTRATQANLSPIFSLHAGDAYSALAPGDADFVASATDDEGTVNRLHRIADPARIEAAQRVYATQELLIADGHHRYETARVYAQEIGGEGEHRYVLMCLVSLEDPGLTVFPTHRLIKDVKDPALQERLGTGLRELFDVEPVEHADLRPPDGTGKLVLGLIDSHHKQAFRLTLKDQATADEALRDYPEPYRTLDTAVLEALVLKGLLGMTEESIGHLENMGYSRTDDEALQLVLCGEYDTAFFLRSSPVRQVQEIAAAGVNMPPKSTFFYPKVPTGLLFSPLA